MNCFDRDNESNHLWRIFEDGRSVLMLAPRRIGKTVLLNRLREEAEARGYQAVLMDVEGFRDEKAFFQQMCAALQEELGFGQSLLGAVTDRLKRLVSGTENYSDWRQILLNTEWKVFAGHLLGQLSSVPHGKPWLFLVDEVPVFVKALLESSGVERAHDFLYTLRNLRQKHAQVRWLFTGSIGLDSIARRNTLEGALVDLEIVPLEPFDEQTAGAFIEYIARREACQIDSAGSGELLRRLGWYSPYYLEKMTRLACAEVGVGGIVGAEHASRAAERMLDLEHRTYWATWREHLDKNFAEPERTDLFTLLDALAQAPGGLSAGALPAFLNRGERVVGNAVVQQYLDTLEADGYLASSPDRANYRFRVSLLREWWLRYVAPRA